MPDRARKPGSKQTALRNLWAECGWLQKLQGQIQSRIRIRPTNDITVIGNNWLVNLSEKLYVGRFDFALPPSARVPQRLSGQQLCPTASHKKEDLVQNKLTNHPYQSSLRSTHHLCHSSFWKNGHSWVDIPKHGVVDLKLCIFLFFGRFFAGVHAEVLPSARAFFICFLGSFSAISFFGFSDSLFLTSLSAFNAFLWGILWDEGLTGFAGYWRH